MLVDYRNIFQPRQSLTGHYRLSSLVDSYRRFDIAIAFSESDEESEEQEDEEEELEEEQEPEEESEEGDSEEEKAPVRQIPPPVPSLKARIPGRPPPTFPPIVSSHEFYVLRLCMWHAWCMYRGYRW